MSSWSYCLFFIHHGMNKLASLHGAGANGFSAAFTEQTRHRGLVCQAELALILW